MAVQGSSAKGAGKLKGADRKRERFLSRLSDDPAENMVGKSTALTDKALMDATMTAKYYSVSEYTARQLLRDPPVRKGPDGRAIPPKEDPDQDELADRAAGMDLAWRMATLEWAENLARQAQEYADEVLEEFELYIIEVGEVSTSASQARLNAGSNAFAWYHSIVDEAITIVGISLPAMQRSWDEACSVSPRTTRSFKTLDNAGDRFAMRSRAVHQGLLNAHDSMLLRAPTLLARKLADDGFSDDWSASLANMPAYTREFFKAQQADWIAVSKHRQWPGQSKYESPTSDAKIQAGSRVKRSLMMREISASSPELPDDCWECGAEGLAMVGPPALLPLLVVEVGKVSEMLDAHDSEAMPVGSTSKPTFAVSSSIKIAGWYTKLNFMRTCMDGNAVARELEAVALVMPSCLMMDVSKCLSRDEDIARLDARMVDSRIAVPFVGPGCAGAPILAGETAPSEGVVFAGAKSYSTSRGGSPSAIHVAETAAVEYAAAMEMSPADAEQTASEEASDLEGDEYSTPAEMKAESKALVKLAAAEVKLAVAESELQSAKVEAARSSAALAASKAAVTALKASVSAVLREAADRTTTSEDLLQQMNRKQREANSLLYMMQHSRARLDEETEATLHDLRLSAASADSDIQRQRYAEAILKVRSGAHRCKLSILVHGACE